MAAPSPPIAAPGARPAGPERPAPALAPPAAAPAAPGPGDVAPGAAADDDAGAAPPPAARGAGGRAEALIESGAGGGAGALVERLLARLAAPTDAAALAAFRAVFGLVLCVSLVRFLAFGWVDELILRPRFLFKYWFFPWAEPLARGPMHALFWGLAALSLCVAAGLFYRASVVLLLVGFAYVQLLDVTNYLNHYYLVTLLLALCALMPLGRAYSADARLFARRGLSHFPAWCTYLLRFQVGVVYFYAGLAKANADWLLSAQPLNLWLSGRTHLPLVGPLLGQVWVAYAMSWAGFLFDTSVPFLLSWRTSRPFAYAVVIVFHAATQALFPIGMFPTIMVTSALVFFPPDWPRRLFGRRARPAPPPPAAPRAPGPAARAALAAGLLWCAFQAAMPLRSHLYGGNVLWHEQGMRFAWRVMLREKNGSITYRVDDPRSGREWVVSPHEYLTQRQERDFSGQPDLILQLGHRIARDFRERGYPDVRVRVEALVSLNGRKPALLFDPEVDLTKVRDGLGRADYLLPAPASPPGHVRRL
ncbi:MAG TPA: HTTM domain-containing protein [Polyangiaceae bacterium]|nr:HTTM domain-containing protein [Polyangiaceae bacterium]